MLQEMIQDGFGNKEDYNCAEKIIYGANQAYGLGLSDEACKLLAGFGGGMGIEHLCGALAGAVAVLSSLYVEKNAHESNRIKELTGELLHAYDEKMGALNCKPLKEAHRNDTVKCTPVIAAAAQILDGIVSRESPARAS